MTGHGPAELFLLRQALAGEGRIGPRGVCSHGFWRKGFRPDRALLSLPSFCGSGRRSNTRQVL